jgi:hypothetical protein
VGVTVSTANPDVADAGAAALIAAIPIIAPATAALVKARRTAGAVSGIICSPPSNSPNQRLLVQLPPHSSSHALTLHVRRRVKYQRRAAVTKAAA